MLGKMLQIAARLGARVQGDDGEIYTSIDDHPGLPPTTPIDAVRQDAIPAYERRERLWNLLIYGLIAIVIAAAVFFDLW